MSRFRRSGVLAGVVVGLCVADLGAGVFGLGRPVPKAGPAAAPSAPSAPSAAPARPDDRRPRVWVVDGAGDLRGCSNALAAANALAGSPVELSVFAWSHGHRRLLKDQTDVAHARAQGERLAAALVDERKAHPGRRIVVVAHSAGSGVALAAGDALPPDTIDRMILLAPSVSAGYDVRPTLRAAREGVDVFCSKKDWVALGFVTRVVGTVDRRWASAAGRTGFRLKGPTAPPEDEADRLRQHFWTADVAWTGHTGGHHGMHAPAFVQAFVLPLAEAR